MTYNLLVHAVPRWTAKEFSTIVPCCPTTGGMSTREIAPGSLKTLIAMVSLIIFSIHILWYKKHQFYSNKVPSSEISLWGSTLINLIFFIKEPLSHVVLLTNFTSLHVFNIIVFLKNLNKYLYKNFVLSFERLGRFPPNFVPNIPESYCGHV